MILRVRSNGTRGRMNGRNKSAVCENINVSLSRDGDTGKNYRVETLTSVRKDCKLGIIGVTTTAGKEGPLESISKAFGPRGQVLTALV